jgi:hypothetical protein
MTVDGGCPRSSEDKERRREESGEATGRVYIQGPVTFGLF